MITIDYLEPGTQHRILKRELKGKTSIPLNVAINALEIAEVRRGHKVTTAACMKSLRRIA